MLAETEKASGVAADSAALLVVMGVSGCGKSQLGAAIAQALGLPLIEGDEFHSDANRSRMSTGKPLTDADRAHWLDELGQQLQQHPGGAVLTCSALKRAYRDRLRAAAPGLRFAWMDISRADAEKRVMHRQSHFFPPGLVGSQFDALEPPLHEIGVLRLDALLATPVLVCQLQGWMGQAGLSAQLPET